MMKKILPLLFSAASVFAPSITKAQTSFSLASAPHDTVIYTYSGSQEYSDNITNTSTSMAGITITWRIIATDFPSEWLTSTALGFCDNSVCYYNTGGNTLWNSATNTGATHTSNTYAYNVPGLFALSLNLPGTTSAQSHWMKVSASISGTIGSVDTVTFIINQPVTSGVQNINSTDVTVSLYPNPAANEVNITYDADADIKSIAVYNLIGKVMNVYKTTANNSANLDLSNLPSGIYFARLVNGHGQVVVTKKFTKQ